jgi:dihydroorotate dehydrogenase electron transfer subunit
MQHFVGQVVTVEPLGPAGSVLWLVAPALASMTSGQFVMARCGDGLDPLLRRGLSLHHTARADGAVGFLFGTGKTWTNWLAGRRPGDGVDLIGPLGNGFRSDTAARRLLIVAEGLGIAPMVALAEEAVAAGREVTVVVDAPSAGALYPIERLPAAVEVVAFTHDGSTGRQGRASDGFAELLGWADQAFLAGSRRLLDEARALLARHHARTPVQVIVEERMACGVGACLGCVVFTAEGPVASCVAGPVFDLWALRW